LLLNVVGHGILSRDFALLHDLRRASKPHTRVSCRVKKLRPRGRYIAWPQVALSGLESDSAAMPIISDSVLLHVTRRHHPNDKKNP
jgi:hypothetical protein